MDFEWDPEKDAANLAKHGIDVIDAQAVFDDPARIEVDSSRPEHGEHRRKVVGTIDGRVFAVIFTKRGEKKRIISARRARRDERAEYDRGATT